MGVGVSSRQSYLCVALTLQYMRRKENKRNGKGRDRMGRERKGRKSSCVYICGSVCVCLFLQPQLPRVSIPSLLHRLLTFSTPTHPYLFQPLHLLHNYIVLIQFLSLPIPHASLSLLFLIHSKYLPISFLYPFFYSLPVTLSSPLFFLPFLSQSQLHPIHPHSFFFLFLFHNHLHPITSLPVSLSSRHPFPVSIFFPFLSQPQLHLIHPQSHFFLPLFIPPPSPSHHFPVSFFSHPSFYPNLFAVHILSFLSTTPQLDSIHPS